MSESLEAKEPTWARVPAGTYRLGREGGLPDEAPVHEVRLHSFLAAVAPVSGR